MIEITPPDHSVFAIHYDPSVPDAELVEFIRSFKDHCIYMAFYKEGDVYFARKFDEGTQWFSYWRTAYNAISFGNVFCSQRDDYYPIRQRY
jgi:hypothetical protein